jgi:hypothetical protein
MKIEDLKAIYASPYLDTNYLIQVLENPQHIKYQKVVDFIVDNFDERIKELLNQNSIFETMNIETENQDRSLLLI